MADVFDSTTRSAVMRAVRGKNSAPELIVRRALHRLGYRYRLHRADLPGTPDLVFPVRRKVLFVHGCFWHRHRCAAGRSTPSSHVDYWRAKFARNRQRDERDRRKLRAAGWDVLVVWECELTRTRLLQTLRRVVQFLQS